MATDDPEHPVLRGADAIDKTLKYTISIATSLVTIVSAVVAFVKSAGGLQQTMVEIGFLGVAAYVALFFIVAPISAAVDGLESLTSRETKSAVTAGIIGVSAIGGALFVRYMIFDDNVTTDLDAIGTAFGVVLGIAVLAAPLVALWYLFGSQPASN